MLCCFSFQFLASSLPAPQLPQAITIKVDGATLEKSDTQIGPLALRMRFWHGKDQFENVKHRLAAGESLSAPSPLPSLLSWPRACALHLCIDSYLIQRILPTPCDPVLEKKTRYFLGLLDVYSAHTAELGDVRPPPPPLPTEVLDHLSKDPQNKYFSWFPPLHYCQIIIILITNHRVLRWNRKKYGSGCNSWGKIKNILKQHKTESLYFL